MAVSFKPLELVTAPGETELPKSPPIIHVKKKPQKKKFFSRLPTLLLLAAVIYILGIFGGLKLELYRADNQISELQQRKEQLLAEHEQLLKEKEKLNNPVYIERRARESLGLIKPGEKVLTPAKPGQVLSLKLEGIDEIGD